MPNAKLDCIAVEYEATRNGIFNEQRLIRYRRRNNYRIANARRTRTVLSTSLKSDYPGRYETLIIVTTARRPLAPSVITGVAPPCWLRARKQYRPATLEALAFPPFDYVDGTCRGATVQLLANCYSHRSSAIAPQEAI